MTYSYSLPIHDIEESLEDAIRNILDGEPLTIGLELDDYEVDELLAESQRIADIWSVYDVTELRPDLTPAQAWDVLKTVQQQYDADFGISNQVIAEAALALFGPTPDL